MTTSLPSFLPPSSSSLFFSSVFSLGFTLSSLISLSLRRSAHPKGPSLPSHYDSILPFFSHHPSPPRLARSFAARHSPAPVSCVSGTAQATLIPLVLCMSGSVQTASPALVGLASSLVKTIGGIRLDLDTDLYSSCALSPHGTRPCSLASSFSFRSLVLTPL